MNTQATENKVSRSKFSADTANRGRVNARYDAAQRTPENANLWRGVDSLSSAAANSPSVRKIIRDRARYEVANNGYAGGIVNTLANDIVGPSAQLQLGDSDKAQKIEREFEHWADEIKLWSKIRTAQKAKIVDGEAFAMFVTNRNLENKIKLDIRLIECDMIEGYFTAKTEEVDGVKLDKNGNPIEYRLLETHPGDYRALSKGAGGWVARKYMMHYFRSDRPGQIRGVSEIVSSLSLFGQLRRFTTAVIESASRAAEISAIMQTDLLPDNLAAELADPVTVLDIERNAVMSLPEGWKLSQLKPEQPTTTYAEFKKQIINEAGRPLNMPLNVATCDSSGYNYASGRLDHQTYDRSINIERAELRGDMLDRIYTAWLEEYSASTSLTREELEEITDHTWNFSGRDHVDPAKEASADNTRFNNGSLTKADYFSKRGRDWKREEKQRIGEMITQEVMWDQARKDAGLEPAPYPRNINQEPIQQEQSQSQTKPETGGEDE